VDNRPQFTSDKLPEAIDIKIPRWRW